MSCGNVTCGFNGKLLDGSCNCAIYYTGETCEMTFFTLWGKDLLVPFYVVLGLYTLLFSVFMFDLAMDFIRKSTSIFKLLSSPIVLAKIMAIVFHILYILNLSYYINNITVAPSSPLPEVYRTVVFGMYLVPLGVAMSLCITTWIGILRNVHKVSRAVSDGQKRLRSIVFWFTAILAPFVILFLILFVSTRLVAFNSLRYGVTSIFTLVLFAIGMYAMVKYRASWKKRKSAKMQILFRRTMYFVALLVSVFLMLIFATFEAISRFSDRDYTLVSIFTWAFLYFIFFVFEFLFVEKYTIGIDHKTGIFASSGSRSQTTSSPSNPNSALSSSTAPLHSPGGGGRKGLLGGEGGGGAETGVVKKKVAWREVDSSKSSKKTTGGAWSSSGVTMRVSSGSSTVMSAISCSETE
eukprot:TRINITY_DN752_c0_g1_i1.p1 TRINITY_DN752_c0_g1~~TRINITY_DN752_c0_g1_i1.p1  ORF type:complete len:408 (-),score=59.66 TRINITY_DN752_c0_g1_i1:267-1490(-)